MGNIHLFRSEHEVNMSKRQEQKNIGSTEGEVSMSIQQGHHREWSHIMRKILIGKEKLLRVLYYYYFS